MKIYKLSVALEEAIDCKKRFGGTWHILTYPNGIFNIVKEENMHEIERKLVIDTI